RTACRASRLLWISLISAFTAQFSTGSITGSVLPKVNRCQELVFFCLSLGGPGASATGGLRPAGLQSGANAIGHLGCRGRSSQVSRTDLALTQNPFDSFENSARLILLAHRIQEIDGRQEQRQGIGSVRPDRLTAAAVEGFEYAHVIADVNARSGADAAHDAR